MRYLIILSITMGLFISCTSNKKNNDKNLWIYNQNESYMDFKWILDTIPVLKRSPGKYFDSQVVGDPCIVWDEELNTWRMFYFAGGYDEDGLSGSRTGMALSKSQEEIGPGDWYKIEPVRISNKEDLLNERSWHKWWIIMDAKSNNRAARIKGKYWAVFGCTVPSKTDKGSNKNIMVASAEELGGPWTVNPTPVLSPDENWFDGRHCDTPTAYWFDDRNEVIIFYKAYPKISQDLQPGSPFGSGTVVARWHPDKIKADKIKAIQRPGQFKGWNQGWMSTPQIFYYAKENQWYGLINGSPTPPEDDSNREPAPSLGGWVKCSPGKWVDGDWAPDTLHSPFMYPENLSEPELKAGLGVNFWRHHLLETPKGKRRIFFNSGKYGTEQMYSLYSNK